MRRYLITGIVLAAFASGASAQPGPADVKAIVGNLGETVDALATGIGNTANALLGDSATTLISNKNAQETAAALNAALSNTLSEAIEGAPTLGSFSTAITFLSGDVANLLDPVLTAVENPSAATIQEALLVNDLQTIAQNLQPAVKAAVPQLRTAAIDLLNGNLREPFVFGGLLPGGGAFFESLSALAAASTALTKGTNLAPLGAPLVGVVPVTSIALGTAADPVLKPLEKVTVPLADAAAPLTDPIVEAIKQAPKLPQ